MSVQQILNLKTLEFSQSEGDDQSLMLTITSDHDLAASLGRYTDVVKRWAHAQGRVAQARRVKESLTYLPVQVFFLKGYEDLPRVLQWLGYGCELEGFVEYIELSPYLQAFRLALVGFEHPLDEFNVRSLRDEQAVGFVQAINVVFRVFRAQVLSPEFKRQLGLSSRLMYKNRRSLYRLFDGLFEKHSRLLVIRLDTGFKDELKPFVTGHGVHSYRVQLIAYVQQNFASLLAYAWKIEFMPKKGLHIHWVWVFNANEVRADSRIAQRIGEYWQTITQDGGHYYNCNANQRAYEHSALGEIRRDDLVKRGHLSLVVDYLTKGDDYIRVKLPSGRRAFGKSVLKQA